MGADERSTIPHQLASPGSAIQNCSHSARPYAPRPGARQFHLPAFNPSEVMINFCFVSVTAPGACAACTSAADEHRLLRRLQIIDTFSQISGRLSRISAKRNTAASRNHHPHLSFQAMYRSPSGRIGA
jgi:hypothetical protein